MRSSDSSRLSGVWTGFAVRLALFAAPLLCAGLLLEWGLAKTSNLCATKRDLVMAKGARVETLIVGSSNAFYGIAPRQLSRPAFNLAFVGEPLYYTDQVITRVITGLPRLKRIIVAVGYVSLRFRMRGEGLEYLYWQEWKIPPQSPGDYLDVRMFSRSALWVSSGPAHTLLAAGKALWDGEGSASELTMDDSGWGLDYASSSDLSSSSAKSKIKIHRRQMRVDDMPDNMARLEHLIAVARQHGVEVDLVTMPVWSSYFELMDQGIWGEERSTYERLARQPGVRYFNFLRPPELTADDFYDADHLDKRGAIRFTKLLDAALLNPAEGRQPSAVEEVSLR